MGPYRHFKPKRPQASPGIASMGHLVGASPPHDTLIVEHLNFFFEHLQVVRKVRDVEPGHEKGLYRHVDFSDKLHFLPDFGARLGQTLCEVTTASKNNAKIKKYILMLLESAVE
jgi:hypothetical protein